jgi:uncharacterized protein (UPF0332 family)
MAQEEWEVWLGKAKECLRSAQSACGRGLNNCAANRSYYSAYLAELAALQKFAKLKLPAKGWRHPTVVRSFNHRLVRTRKLFEIKIIGQVTTLEALRIKGDYSPENVTGQEAQEGFTIARGIVNIIAQKIGESDATRKV